MSTSPVMTITDELLSEIEAAAYAATPQRIDSAEDIIKADPGAMIECPVCGGDGYASLENDYCNFDNHAIGVQFYGIGSEFGLAEEYYRRANPATTLALIAELRRLRAENAELQRIERNRDMWKAQCEQQAISLTEANAVYIAAIKLVSNIRFASGDNGLRMQPELIDFIAELAKDAGRYRHIVRWLSHYGAGGGRGVCMPSDYSSSTKEECDASIDAEMQK